jgi:hypothetical protein
MANSSFSIGSLELGQARASNFEEVLSIIKGRSIVSAADWGEERIELGLSGGAILRWLKTNDGMQINVISSVNKDEVPPIVLSLGDMPQRVPMYLIERKLRGLRTLYAIFLLAQTDRHRQLEDYVLRHPFGDIEHALIHPNEALYVESLSYGSWIATVWTATKTAVAAVTSLGGLVFVRGREAFISKLEGQARLANAQADREEIGARSDEFNLRKSQVDYLLEVTSKIENPVAKGTLEKRIAAAARQIVEGDKTDRRSYKVLASPKR